MLTLKPSISLSSSFFFLDDVLSESKNRVPFTVCLVFILVPW